MTKIQRHHTLLLWLCLLLPHTLWAIGNDTTQVKRLTPTYHPFAYKGEVMMGLSASYASINSDNSTLLLLLDQIDVSGKMTAIKPFIGYFYTDDRCVGIHFGYTHYLGGITSGNLNLGASNDLSLSVPPLSLSSNHYNYALFHRSYTPIDRQGRIALFSEVEAGYTHGITRLGFNDNTSESLSHQASLNFNPGVALFILPNVCTTFSFGMGGLNYTKVDQIGADGQVTGGRESSNLSFKFNLMQINFGITIHLWQ